MDVLDVLGCVKDVLDLAINSTSKDWCLNTNLLTINCQKIGVQTHHSNLLCMNDEKFLELILIYNQNKRTGQENNFLIF